MGLLNWARGELIDIIEWTQVDEDTMAYRFPRYRNEIKFGAKLVVREGQTAILVNLGQIADVFPPGIYELTTENLPILSSLQHWQHGFESPFKAEVYFFNTTDFLSLKWGTKQPVTVSDANFGLVRLRGFGSYTLRLNDPAVFLRKLVGTDGNFEIQEVSEQLSQAIVSQLSQTLGQANFTLADLAGRYEALAKQIQQALITDFSDYGLEMGRLYIESISLPESVQQVLDDKTGLAILGDDLDEYTKMQAAKGMKEGGNAGSDMASAGVGMALGMQMAREMTQGSSQDISEQLTSEIPAMPKIYYVMIAGKRVGPLTHDAVQEKINQHDIDTDTLCWKKGMSEWKRLAEITEFDLTNVPPPLPDILKNQDND